MRPKKPPEPTPLFDWHDARRRTMTSAAADVMNRRTAPGNSGTPKTVVRHRLRVNAIEALIRHRYGPGGVDTDAEGEIYIRAVAPHLMALPAPARGKDREPPSPSTILISWAGRWTPKAFEEIDVGFWFALAENPGRWLKADVLGKRLRVTKAEIDALGLSQIGGLDWTKRDRERARRQADAVYQKARRAAVGANPREQSKQVAKPWIVLGISRAKFYRMQKAGTLPPSRETVSSAIEMGPSEPRETVSSAPISYGDNTTRRFRLTPAVRSCAAQFDLLAGGPPPSPSDVFEGFTGGKLTDIQIIAIRDEQYRRGLDQVELGRQIGLSQPQISNMFSRRFGTKRQTAERIREWLRAA